MNTKDVNQRRQAIYTGLHDFMDEQDLERAVQHWENSYADQPSLALQRFVAYICNEDSALKKQRSAVLRSLLNAMNLPVNELQKKTSRNTSNISQENPQALSHNVAFSALILALMSQLNESQQTKLKLDLFAALRRRKLPHNILDALQRWLSNRQALELNNAPASLLQKLINQFYVLLCESVGPIQADRMLANAVQQLQREQPELDLFLSSLL
ncbi:hypothetical protein IMCC21906_01488 [Spongiibacter sp. IMCC21906]|uniref:hypothetical protein n=1 Tax=Spongiibacter sp. IMCC21906 TaxID=1620392 RepID=UPI00062E04AC|nr:hypothetical protein [Spongiibacter sp. IMCC21906]AKH69166.1 hypothetical protein IMCC21906_01488 [Spongiibacter sp. IMCC21906]